MSSVSSIHANSKMNIKKDLFMVGLAIAILFVVTVAIYLIRYANASTEDHATSSGSSSLFQYKITY